MSLATRIALFLFLVLLPVATYGVSMWPTT